MKIIDKKDMSKWAYYQCLNGNDIPEMRSLITHNEWVFWYCKNIEDIEEMWRKITDSIWAYIYCKHVKNRPEIRKYVIKEWQLRSLNIMMMDC